VLSLSRIAAAAAVAVACGLTAGAAEARSACTANSLNGELLQRTNALRSARGLRPLNANAKLAKAALDHACDMASRAGFGHRGSDGSDIRARERRHGYRGCSFAEVIAWGYKTVDKAMAGWEVSPAHMSILMDPNLRDYGAALAWNGDTPFWSVALGAPCR
jgi:uncharacterized protein YkwD